MMSARILAMSLALVVSPPLISAQNLSTYREFQLGMSLASVAQKAHIGAEPRAIHRRPELIQELMWQPPRAADSALQGDSVWKVLFSFYNDQLYRIVVTYDRTRTEGLTADDMVEAVSATYGRFAPPRAQSTQSISSIPNDRDKILGVWENDRASINLFRSVYLSTYGLLVLSKQLDAEARVAIAESLLLDEQEAPQRELDNRQKLTEDERARQESARRANKATFRP